jgi:hypothetical protein
MVAEGLPGVTPALRPVAGSSIAGILTRRVGFSARRR